MEGRPAYQSAHPLCRPLRSPAIRRAGSHQRVFGNFCRRPGRGIRHHPGGKPKLEFSRDLEETGRYLMRRVPAMAAFAATREFRGEHDPEKWVPVFPRDKREAFARRSCSNRKIERDDDSKKSHAALDPVTRPSSAHPSSALSTSARDGPACPSSDGGDRRCCPLPPPVRRRLSPAQCRTHFPYGGLRTA